MLKGKRHQIAGFEDLAWPHKPMHDCDVSTSLKCVASFGA